jgi:hypothetical protein
VCENAGATIVNSAWNRSEKFSTAVTDDLPWHRCAI